MDPVSYSPHLCIEELSHLRAKKQSPLYILHSWQLPNKGMSDEVDHLYWLMVTKAVLGYCDHAYIKVDRLSQTTCMILSSLSLILPKRYSDL